MICRRLSPPVKSLGLRIASLAIGFFGWFTRPFAYRGLSRVASIVAWCYSQPAPKVGVTVAEDTIFAISLDDGYWSRLISAGYVYEPEIEALCRRLTDIDFTFFDFGANKGYWTLLMSGKEMGYRPVVAVEPHPNTFALLQENVAANARDVTLICAAISSNANSSVSFYDRGDHSGATLELSWNHHPNSSLTQYTVSTTTIDQVCMNHVRPDKPCILKIDIEGHELAALKGAVSTLATSPLIIYEEHGATRDAELSRYIRDTLGLHVFFIDDLGLVHEIHDDAGVTDKKNNRKKGYNFCACSSESVFFPKLVTKRHG